MKQLHLQRRDVLSLAVFLGMLGLIIALNFVVPKVL